MPEVRTLTRLDRVFRFGEFEYSARSGELLQNGEVVRLQYQPLRVLQLLLENGGEVVTRDEIRGRVWEQSPIRDFDNSLRGAVNKLRQALDDDPENPVYIETLPRRGYRWLYPVIVDDGEKNSEELVEESSAKRRDGHQGGRRSVDYASPGKPTRGEVFKRSVLTLMLSLAALVAIWQLRPREELAEPRVVPLTTYPGLESMPAISPNGKQVAFAWTGPDPNGAYRVYVKDMGEDRAQPLVETPAGAADSDPVWTPDGKSLLFFRRGGKTSGIYMAPASGGKERLVVATSMARRRLRRGRFDVSPVANLLVYPDELPGRETIGLFLLDLNTLQSHQITSPPPNTEGDGDPAFSHDGKLIAFQRDTIDRGEIFALPVSGGSERLLTTSFIRDFIDGLAWTADDREIVFGGKQLRRVSARGGESSISTLSYAPGPGTFPAVRDHLLAYVQDKTNTNVWKLNLRDLTHSVGEPSKLISSTQQQAAAAFSPDGSRMAFQSDRSGEWEVWVCERDGSNARQLTHFSGAPSGTPRWAPDGKQIAFDSRANGVSQIYVISAEGGEPRQVTKDATGGQMPYWSHNGKWIYYSAVRNQRANIWKLSVDAGSEEPVTKNSGLYAAESSDGKYLYYSRNSLDSTIWRIPIGGGAEEQVSGVPKPFDPSHWVLVSQGIYVIDGDGDLYFYRFSNGSVTKVIHDARFIADWSMAISPDGREIVWTQIDVRTADVMLVENFH